MREAYEVLYQITVAILGLAMLCCLIRAVRGPRIADRLIAVNMLGSLAIITICVLAFLLSEGYLVDVALVYAMLSFLAVVLLTKIYIGVYRARRQRAQQEVKTDEHA